MQLVELDISGNNMGDKTATLLSEALSKNTSLTSLKWDDNSVNLGGWQTFVSVMKNNKTLKTMPLPERDITKAIAK